MGESIGKKNELGSRVGFTPIPAYGSTDQHSQMQLFMEGQRINFLFLFRWKNLKLTFH